MLYLILQCSSQSLFAFLYFKFLERDGNRGLWPASVILIELDWIYLITAQTETYLHV